MHSFINPSIYSTDITYYMPGIVLGVGNRQSSDSTEDYFLVVGDRQQIIVFQAVIIVEANNKMKRSISDAIYI